MRDERKEAISDEKKNPLRNKIDAFNIEEKVINKKVHYFKFADSDISTKTSEGALFKIQADKRVIHEHIYTRLAWYLNLLTGAQMNCPRSHIQYRKEKLALVVNHIDIALLEDISNPVEILLSPFQESIPGIGLILTLNHLLQNPDGPANTGLNHLNPALSNRLCFIDLGLADYSLLVSENILLEKEECRLPATNEHVFELVPELLRKLLQPICEIGLGTSDYDQFIFHIHHKLPFFHKTLQKHDKAKTCFLQEIKQMLNSFLWLTKHEKFQSLLLYRGNESIDFTPYREFIGVIFKRIYARANELEKIGNEISSELTIENLKAILEFILNEDQFQASPRVGLHFDNEVKEHLHMTRSQSAPHLPEQGIKMLPQSSSESLPIKPRNMHNQKKTPVSIDDLPLSRKKIIDDMESPLLNKKKSDFVSSRRYDLFTKNNRQVCHDPSIAAKSPLRKSIGVW